MYKLSVYREGGVDREGRRQACAAARAECRLALRRRGEPEGRAPSPGSLPQAGAAPDPRPPWPPPTWQAAWFLSWAREPGVLGLHHRVNSHLSALGKQGRSKWRNSDNI